MTAELNILAAGEDAFQTIVVVVFVVLGLIGSIVSKAAKQKQEKQAAEQERQRRARTAEAEAAERQAAQGRPGPRRPPVTTARAAPPPIRRPKPQRLGTGVATELTEQRRRVQHAEAARQRRLEARNIPEADDAAYARLGRLKTTETPVAAVAQESRVGMDLRNRNRIRQAIIYHEVLSRPKGLRSEAEMWDV